MNQPGVVLENHEGPQLTMQAGQYLGVPGGRLTQCRQGAHL